MNTRNIVRFVKDWALVFSMLTGAAGYFAFAAVPSLVPLRHAALQTVQVVQPTLLFFMLFLSFCKVDPRRLRLRRMFLPMLAFQCVPFALLALVPVLWPESMWVCPIEAAMICLICPTATAATVVTVKLGGNAENVTSYLMLSNLACALMVPLFIPLVNPHAELAFFQSFLLIIGQIFPLLICPFLLAAAVRFGLPRLHARLAATRNLVFNLWICNLSLAIAVTTHHLVHTDAPAAVVAGIMFVSLVACALQFAFGRLAGRREGFPISSSQALGQKNTVFAIWMGYTFLNPVTSVAGGFYSIWHNVYNARQLHRAATGRALPREQLCHASRAHDKTIET